MGKDLATVSGGSTFAVYAPANNYAQGMNLLVDTLSNGNVEALKFADLGSASVAYYSMSNALDNVDPLKINMELTV